MIWHMCLWPAINIVLGKEGEDAMHFSPSFPAFLEISMGAVAQTGFNFCKKGMEKKHCKMDIGRENNVISAKKFPKKNSVK